MNKDIKIVVFGGGCFWCTEAIFKSLKGVVSVTSGYSGARPAELERSGRPTYEKVSMGTTGHAECIKIEYNPSVISFEDLLSVFFNTHDPTTLNRQGADIGTQYRSVIFYTDQSQKEEAENLVKELNDSGAYQDLEGKPKKVVTEVVPFTDFFEAEDYHKDYYKNNEGNAYCDIVIAPKLEKLQKRFANLIK